MAEEKSALEGSQASVTVTPQEGGTIICRT